MKSFTVCRAKVITPELRPSSCVSPAATWNVTFATHNTKKEQWWLMKKLSPKWKNILPLPLSSLWIDDQLIDLLHQAGKYVTIETNGTHPLPASIDWVTCSPKQGAKLAIDRMNEVKVVYEGQDISIFELLPAEHFFLQPCSCNNTALTVDCVMRHPKWRLSLQTHKLIDIRWAK